MALLGKNGQALGAHASVFVPKTRLGQLTVVDIPQCERPLARNDQVVVFRRPDLNRDFSGAQIHGGGAPGMHADVGMIYQVMSIGPGSYDGDVFHHIGATLQDDDICYANSWQGGIHFTFKRRNFQMFAAEDMMARIDRSEQRLPIPILDTVITRPAREKMSVAIWGDLRGMNGKQLVVPSVDQVEGLAADEALDDPSRYVFEEVVAVGPGREGQPPPPFAKGDLVVLTKGHTTCDLYFKGKPYTLSPASHIQAVLPPDE